MKNQQSIAKNSDNKEEVNIELEMLARNQQKQIDELTQNNAHPNSIKAIEPYQFKKGQSGNTNGRPPKNMNLAKSLQRIGNEVEDDVFNDGNKTNRDRVLDEIWKLARLGDKDMMKLLVQVGGLE
tara:strand:- start:64 stop:438 length:375 start_codon:yes stop_codon:yes gene_type:complete